MKKKLKKRIPLPKKPPKVEVPKKVYSRKKAKDIQKDDDGNE
jgi:hypothetical protein